MAIAPIIGTYKRRIVFDIATGTTIGTAAAFYWWYGIHMPQVERRDNYYAMLKAKKDAEAE